MSDFDTPLQTFLEKAMNESIELKAKIKSLREELERTEEELLHATASEAGLTIGKTLIKGSDGAVYRVTKVTTFGDQEFVNVSGNKRLKNGAFSGREEYAGLLGYHGCEILAEQETQP